MVEMLVLIIAIIGWGINFVPEYVDARYHNNNNMTGCNFSIYNDNMNVRHCCNSTACIFYPNNTVIMKYSLPEESLWAI